MECSLYFLLCYQNYKRIVKESHQEGNFVYWAWKLPFPFLTGYGRQNVGHPVKNHLPFDPIQLQSCDTEIESDPIWNLKQKFHYTRLYVYVTIHLNFVITLQFSTGTVTYVKTASFSKRSFNSYKTTYRPFTLSLFKVTKLKSGAVVVEKDQQ